MELSLGLSGKPVKPYSVGGLNVSNAMNLSKIKDLTAAIAAPTYTWPAGNVGDEYPLNKQEVDFLRIQTKLLPPGLWFNQVNLFKGSIETSLEQMRNAKAAGLETAVWHIGNEPDLYAAHRGAPEWTPEHYAKVFREWVTAIKKEFPNARFSGPTISNPYDQWMEVFIRECGDLVDVLSWHWYPTDSKKSNPEALATSTAISEQIARYQGWLKDPEKNPRGYQRPIETAISEFAIHWNTQDEYQINDITGALWTADVLGRMAQAGLDYSHYFCLGEYGGHAIISKGSKARTIYHVFEFYATLRDGARLMTVSPAEGPVKVHGWIAANGNLELVMANHGTESIAGLVNNFSDLPAGMDLGAYQVLSARSLDAKGVFASPADSYGLRRGEDSQALITNVPGSTVLHFRLGKK